MAISGALVVAPSTDCLLVFHVNDPDSTWTATFQGGADSQYFFDVWHLPDTTPATYSAATIVKPISAGGQVSRARSGAPAWGASLNHGITAIFVDQGDFTLTFASTASSIHKNFGPEALDLVGGTLDVTLPAYTSSGASGSAMLHVDF